MFTRLIYNISMVDVKTNKKKQHFFSKLFAQFKSIIGLLCNPNKNNVCISKENILHLRKQIQNILYLALPCCYCFQTVYIKS